MLFTFGPRADAPVRLGVRADLIGDGANAVLWRVGFTFVLGAFND